MALTLARKASAFEEELLEGHPVAELEVHPKVFLGWSLQNQYLTSITLWVVWFCLITCVRWTEHGDCLPENVQPEGKLCD